MSENNLNYEQIEETTNQLETSIDNEITIVTPTKKCTLGELSNKYINSIIKFVQDDDIYKNVCILGSKGKVDDTEVKLACNLAVDRIVNDKFFDKEKHYEFHMFYKKYSPFTQKIYKRIFE